MVTTSTRNTSMRGDVAEGFGPVADAFMRNFDEHGDVGAACTVIVDGEAAVDIYSGSAAPGRQWTAETRSVLFSVSKGVTALCLVMAEERGLLDLDDPVAQYWPEFAAHGKDALTVRQMLAHRAGLVFPGQPLSAADLVEWFPVTKVLAEQAPSWRPNDAFAYHPITVGFLAGETLRRATGMRPSAWLAEHIAGPLGLKMSFGASADDANVAPIIPPAISEAAPFPAEELEVALQSITMSGALGPDLFSVSRSEAFLRPELPAANIVSTARDLATMYAATVSEVDGIRLLGAESVRDATQPISFGQPFFGIDEGNVWGTGFMIHSRRRKMAGEGSFGHDGAGGQLAFASPAHRLGFAYQTVQAAGQDDTRAELLSSALRKCL